MRKKKVTLYSHWDAKDILLSDFELECDHQLNHFFNGLGIINPITGGASGVGLGDLDNTLPCGNK